MNLSALVGKRSSSFPKQVVLSIITLYSASLFLPVLFRIITPVGNVVLVLAALVCMLWDKDMQLGIKKTALIKFAFAGLLMFYMWWIGLKDIISLPKYMAHSILVWAAMPFYIYISTCNSFKFRGFLTAVILLCMTLTCVTTLIYIPQYPQASRILAGGGEASRIYSWLNIGGFGFVYSLALVTPILFSISFKPYRIWIRITALVLTGLFGFSILLTQYLIAFYMWLLSTSIVLVYIAINAFALYILKKFHRMLSMALAIFIVLVVFIGFAFEINSVVNHLFSTLNLAYLSERTASIDELQGDVSMAMKERQSGVIDNEDDDQTGKYGESSIFQNIISERGPFDPLSSRFYKYFSVVNGVQNHWLTGNLLSSSYSLSFHSDILDAFLGGGLLGAALVTVLLYGIFRGLFRISLNEQVEPYFMLTCLMLLGLGLVNSIFLSRELLYICFIMRAVSLPLPIRNNT